MLHIADQLETHRRADSQSGRADARQWQDLDFEYRGREMRRENK
jgi:hypothetical protein